MITFNNHRFFVEKFKCFKPGDHITVTQRFQMNNLSDPVWLEKGTELIVKRIKKTGGLFVTYRYDSHNQSGYCISESSFKNIEITKVKIS